VKTDSTVTVRPIIIGTTEGDESEVTSGMTPGEVVVMTGVDKLQEGSKVSAQIPTTNPVSPAANQSAGKVGKAPKRS
jgi:multidrug efflux system membrane fusion protein